MNKCIPLLFLLCIVNANASLMRALTRPQTVKREIKWTSSCDWNFNEAGQIALLAPSPSWQEFQEWPENYGVNLHRHESLALSFSVRTDVDEFSNGTGVVSLEFYSKDFTQYARRTFKFKNKKLSKFGESRYTTFTILRRNDSSWDILSEQGKSSINSSLNPQWMFASNRWIIHAYSFLSSQEVSTINSTIFLQNSLNDKCISFLYALNNNSILELYLQTNEGITNATLTANNSALINWQHGCLRRESRKLGILSIQRKLKEGTNGPGFWALDAIKFCDKIDTDEAENSVAYKPCESSFEEQKQAKDEKRNQKDSQDCTPNELVRSKYISNFEVSICACDGTNLTFFIENNSSGIDRVSFTEDKTLSYKGQVIKLEDNKIVLHPLRNVTTGLWILSNKEHNFSVVCDVDQDCEIECSAIETTTAFETTKEGPHINEKVNENSYYILWGIALLISVLTVLTIILYFYCFKSRFADGNSGNEGNNKDSKISNTQQKELHPLNDNSSDANDSKALSPKKSKKQKKNRNKKLLCELMKN